jgi:ribosomal protein L37E
MNSSFLLAHHIPGKIIDIIRESKEYCFIVSPYFQKWNHLEQTLKLSSEEAKKIFFLFRDDQSSLQDIIDLNLKYNFDIYFIKNLHAKIYLNEKEALITSMNLYNYSKEENFEIGYSISNFIQVKELAKDIIAGEILKTWQCGCLRGRYCDEINEEMFLPGAKNRKNSGINQQEAFCIRCGSKISFNIQYPLCASCFETWSKFKNIDYPEYRCHKCGKNAETTYAKPLCYECYKKIYSEF